MDPTKQERVIEYLLTRKFPDHVAIRATSARKGDGRLAARSPGALERQKWLSAAAAYKTKLRAMSPEELAVAVDWERAEDEDRERFFNQPHSLANFQHWAKAAYWSLEEATALSFGKEPGVVNSKSIEPLVGIYSFAADYARVRDLVERAKIMGQIDDPVIPGFYIAWAKRRGISYPPELEAELVAQGQQIGDWGEGMLRKSEANAASTEAERDQLRQEAVDWKAVHDDLKRQHDHLVAERDVLKARVSSLEAQQAEPQGKKDSGPRERETYQRMILGLAMSEAFGYDPNAKNSLAISKIVNAVARKNLTVSKRTVRDKLQEAAKKLGFLTIKR